MQTVSITKKLKMAAILTVIVITSISTGCMKKTKNDFLSPIKVEKNPIATIEMEEGGLIKVELYPETAPNTVLNFIHLANKGFYNGLIFHRVVPGFVVQGGCPEGNGTGGPGYSIGGEFQTNGFENNLRHERGVISMARSKSFDSAGSQFFIMVSDYFGLDGDYAAFGRVIEGMEEVDRIVMVQAKNERPIKDQKIKTITVETFGEKYKKPQTK